MATCRHAFAIYLAGAETPYWRARLTEGGATHVALNFLQLRKERMPKSGLWSVEEKFAPEVEVLADGGGRSAARSDVDHEDHLAAYIRWAALNVGRLSMVVEYDPGGVGLDWVEEHRHLYDGFGAVFVPVWHEEHGFSELEALAQVYERVAITSPSAAVASRLRPLVARTGVRLHGLAITGPDDIQALPLASGSSTSWISPTKYGETQVWAQDRFHWYPASSKEQARRRHAHDIEQAGFDADAYRAGDRKEVARYTAWAWGRFEESVAGQRVAPDAEVVDLSARLAHPASRAPEGGSVDHTASPPHSVELVVRDPQTPFPGLGHRMIEVAGDGPDSLPQQVPVPALSEAGVRRCDSCSLSAVCREYRPASTCAYRFDVQIRTKPQLDAALSTLLEAQYKRISWALTIEEAEGVMLNQDVTAEIQQFYRNVERIKAIQSDTSLFRIEARGQAASGLVSALMAAAGRSAEMPAPAVPSVPLNAGRVEEAIARVLDRSPED